MITVTSVEAQNRFGQLLDTVQREPVVITRHPEFDTFLRKGLYLNDAHVQNCHYNAIFEGFGRLTVSNKSFCSGVRVVSPLADCLRWSVTW